MTDLITAEEAQKLLEHCEMLIENGWEPDPENFPTEAAPDLARTVIALHAELALARADTEAAVALALDEAVSTLAYYEKQWSESDRVTHAKMLGERARADSLTTENQRLQDRERVLKRERDEAVMFLDNAVSKAPEPLRELGGWLANKLDEDEWPTAERFLNAAAKSLADLAVDPAVKALIAAERERCAGECDRTAREADMFGDKHGRQISERTAAAIRNGEMP